MKNKIRLNGFLLTYIIFALVLAVLVASALVYVDSVLDEYEEKHPTRLLEKAVVLLQAEAENGTLYQKDEAPAMISGKFEENKNAKDEFAKKLSGDIKFSPQKWISETECTYNVLSDGFAIAEIKLKKIGEPITKLAIISIQEYELVSYLPISHTYTIELSKEIALSDEISVSVNGIELGESDLTKAEDGKIVYTLSDIYDKPEIIMTDKDGNSLSGKLPEAANGNIEFDATLYTLTLPKQLSVHLDGEVLSGELQGDGRYNYRIRLAKKAKVELSDLFGNKIEYAGTSTVPLTYYTLMTNEGCTVKVNGNDVPDSVMEISPNPEYKNFAELVSGLPRLPVYNIVVLQNDAEVSVTDAKGNDISLEREKNIQDLTGASAPIPLSEIPKDISDKINVIKVLEDWSLFMSCDLDFASLSKHLIKGSYQYNVAYKYNYSIDRTFTSIHSLRSPAFTEETATNFTYLTEDCFSVDIRFVKHMLVSGRNVDDEMNERCYFAKDGAGNWKLVGMKEVINDAK